MSLDEKEGSIGLLLRNILDIINRLEKEVAENDDSYQKEFARLREEIAKLHSFVEYQEILDVLRSNVSPQGLKKLLEDIDAIVKEKEQEKGRKEEASSWKNRAWAISIPLVIFLLGIAWFIIKAVLSGKVPGG